MNADAAQMNVMQERKRLNGLSEKVIGAAQMVSRVLGHGFLEKVYENALCIELTQREVLFTQQMPLEVRYRGMIVGDYVPDLVVERCLILEIKATPSVSAIHRQQCLNYLRTSDLRLGLVLNFGRAHLEVGRVVNHF